MLTAGPRGALLPAADVPGEDALRLLRTAMAARDRVERATVLSQQAGRLLTESDRLVAEAQRMLRDVEREA
jgi:hypothetical protein